MPELTLCNIYEDTALPCSDRAELKTQEIVAVPSQEMRHQDGFSPVYLIPVFTVAVIAACAASLEFSIWRSKKAYEKHKEKVMADPLGLRRAPK